VRVAEAAQTRTVCVLVVLQAVVSFRSVPRMLELLRDLGHLRLGWVPHFSSVIHWTLRLGLAALKQVKPLAGPWVAIMDMSIGIGVKKVLVVLRVALPALAQRGSAIRLEDCECVGLRVSEHSDGEAVAGALSTLFAQAGEPVAIVKDGGTDLAKGVRWWPEREGKKRVWVIEDMGHVLATALKAQYAKSRGFERFVALIQQGAARLRQTNLAFLVPPKLRPQGRFQGISRLGQWAERLLHALGGRGRAPDASELATLRQALAGLAPLRPFIERFATTVRTLAQLLEVLKDTGLNQQSYRHGCQLAEQLPPRSKVKRRLVAWLNRHLHSQCRLGVGQLPLLVSSDIIESLFGTFKHLIARSPQAEINRTVLVIPALCGALDPAAIAQALATTTHRDLQHWEQQHLPSTLRQRRSEFFHKKGDQKPGIQLAPKSL
jgi:hypothetical protein